MSSVKCAHCGLINWSAEAACKRCGNSPHGYDQPPAADWHAPAGFAFDANVKKRTGLAVASLVIGVISIFTLSFLLVGAAAGIILGIVALVKLNRQPQLYGGRGLAIAGIVTSAISVVIVIPLGIIAAIAIPNLLASVRAANEASAIHSLRSIAAAEATYQTTAGQGQYGSLEELEAAGLLEAEVADGRENGYRFVLTPESDGFEATATPEQYGQSGVRSYFVSSEGLLHAADRNGDEADATDSSIE
ncbi:MAG: DUF4190 domain-containing protein [Pyrinomonadaceae bacterium]